MPLTSRSFTDFSVPDEIVTSGDYQSAQNLLGKESAPSEILAERFYRLGNRFYSADQKLAAELAWQKSAILADYSGKVAKLLDPFSQNLRKFHWQTIGAIVIVIVCLYVFVFTLFQREPESFQFSTFQSSSVEHSFWDEWWDTGRPVTRSMRRRFNADGLWPMLQRTLKNLLSEQNKGLSDDVREKLKRWLELSQSPHFGDTPTDYYALTGRGLFEAREFEEALSTLNNGLHYAESPEQMEQLYQDLGTVYYFKGYKLQPNGLARYDLNDVRDSVKSYEMALSFGEDPYLYGNLGWGYYLLGDYSSSIESSLHALALKPELNYVRMNLGIAYLTKGDYELAFSSYASLQQHSPELDEYEGGIRDLLELQQEFPGLYPFINFVMGQLYWQQGRHKEAKVAWQKFLNQNFPEPLWHDSALLLLKKMETE